MTSKRNRAVFGVLLLVFVFFIILMIFATYTMNVFKNESSALGLGKKRGSVAVVEVNGVIMDSKSTIELLNRAEEDGDTKAIIIRINSPGGAVGPVQEIYEEIRRIDSAYTESGGKESKPVYASFGTVAASGGYYLGAACREIWTNPGTITGSIGVIMQFYDLSKLYKLAMIDQKNVKAGRYKDMGQPNRPMTEEERALLDGLVAGVHQQFIEDIENTRKGKIKGGLIEHAQGQIFSGESALEAGLVDRLGSLWAAGRAIHEDLKLKGEFGLKYIKKREKPTLLRFLENVDETVSRFNKISSMFESGGFLKYQL